MKIRHLATTMILCAAVIVFAGETFCPSIYRFHSAFSEERPETPPFSEGKRGTEWKNLCVEGINFPKPHYDRQENDPEWLQKAAEFHGHLGPAVVIGARLGAAGLAAVQSEGYFGIEVTCTGPFSTPPKSCMVDGLQLSTGATLGKRNLTIIDSDEFSVIIVNLKNGKSAILRPNKEILELAWSQLEDDHDDHEDSSKSRPDPIASMKKVEAIARHIAELPCDQIMTIEMKDSH